MRVGVWGDEAPPYRMFPNSDSFEGITADYTRIIQNSLGVNAKIIYFKTRGEAIQALIENKIDIMSDIPGYVDVKNNNLIITQDFSASSLVVVARDSAEISSMSEKDILKIAIAINEPSDAEIKRIYPKAQIIRYSSDKSALSSVALGKNNLYIGNMIVAGFIIARNYTNTLSMTDILPFYRSGARYIIRKSDPELFSALNAIMRSIPIDHQHYLLSQWGGYPDPWRFQNPLELSGQERKWLEQKKTVKVLVNPYLAPYTIINTSGMFQGITADVLRMIHMRTGINFIPVISTSVDGMLENINNRKGDFLAAMTISQPRREKLNFTRPYITTPFVLVVPDTQGENVKLNQHIKVATTKDNTINGFLREKYPAVELLMADNIILAMEMVDEGKADAAVNTQLSTEYMIERYFKGKLKISEKISEEHAEISFGVRWDQPELFTILDKAVAEIEPQDMSLLVNKWQNMPDSLTGTWENYSLKFYALLGIAAGFIILMFLWILYKNQQHSRKYKSHNSMKNQVNFLDKLLDASPTPVYFVDENFQIVKFNKAFSSFFSEYPDISSIRSISDTRHPLYSQIPVITISMRGGNNKDVPFKNKLRIFDGKNHKIVSHWIIPDVNKKGVVTGVICGWIDITFYENNLKSLNNQRQIAESASQAKSSYLATISHEIRTQISPILGVLELEMIHNPENENLNIAFESSRNLLELLGNVLDIAKIEHGKLDLIATWSPLKNIVIPVVKVFEAVANQRGNVIVYHDHNIHPVEVFLDISRLRQVLSNVISNAVKFTEQGTINVEFNCSYTNQHTLTLKVVINDTGIGISEADLKGICEPFTQVGKGKNFKGSGLGLSISRQIISAMDGVFEINSIPDTGTSVLIKITAPVRQAVPYTPGGFLSILEEKSLRILIVDDHPASRLVLMQQLISLGHKVTECVSAVDALKLLNENYFDAVFTDCSMPGMDGYTFTQDLRSSGNDLMVIGLTASAFMSTRIKCIEAGMNECLFKPISISQLKESLLNIQLLNTNFPLSGIIDLKKIYTMMHDNETAIFQLLKKVDDENTKDLILAKNLLIQKDWVNLSRCIHRISGGAQIIHCNVIDQLCKKIEMFCTSPSFEHDIEKAISRLELKLKVLHSAINNFLNELK
nr:transporter substrate-binding domain-containing protein [Type-D symbiont of Plautia stali]